MYLVGLKFMYGTNLSFHYSACLTIIIQTRLVSSETLTDVRRVCTLRIGCSCMGYSQNDPRFRTRNAYGFNDNIKTCRPTGCITNDSLFIFLLCNLTFYMYTNWIPRPIYTINQTDYQTFVLNMAKVFIRLE